MLQGSFHGVVRLILGGGDYLHASLYTRILSRTAKENYSFRAYIQRRTVQNKLLVQGLHLRRPWTNSIL